MSDIDENPDGGFVEGVLHSDSPSPATLALRLLLTPFAWLHQAALEIYLLPYRMGWRRQFRVLRPDGTAVSVISIGNLSSGGTGKTPMTQLVVGHLEREGRRVVVLSRGHGGSGSSATPRIVADGTRILLGPDEAGDEPALLARSLPKVPVIIGRDRRRSARLAVEKFAPDVIVLDDALQYWQLHRDLDIVLLDARRPFDNGYVIPRGLLREPPSHLARAGIVVLTRADAAAPVALLETRARIASLAPKASIFTATHAPLGWVSPAATDVAPLAAFRGLRAVVFSAVADNAAFAQSVEAQGIDMIAREFLGDHHAYNPEDVARIVQAATRAEADVVLTTEKDLVKVAPLWPVDATELCALRIGMRVADEDEFFGAVGDFA